ncbi:hypothetical protein AB205_0088890 [Aquarana catesbeiana]|uniref:Amidase domain-containing protein n=1 Tax=Aquarana catesbeiana TaxID=8400 RepID=A0A2G9RCN1_AQUCT|nr:hypothetical protein AB205_0088890 [Aquarana catesbeiana]
MVNKVYHIPQQALEVHSDLNCVTVFMSDCETQIKKLQEREERGPLYGVPVSIKEHVSYQGHPSTCGLAQYLDVLEEEDSVMVKVLKKQGAVVFAKTNVPQTLICFETSNTIYGHTKNPHNTAKGASGSSGGEGALIGGGGSVLGFGTDLAGSIRLPSSFCGIAGFKPTSLRLSMSGVRPCIDGMTAVPLCIGPMAQDVDGLVLVMKALLCDEMFNLDPNVPPISTSMRRSIQEHWMDHVALQEYQAEFIREEWKKLNMDAIICPMLGPAFNIGYPGKLLAAISYTMLYNMLQFPAGVVPVGFVTKEDEKALRHYTGYNNDHWDKCFKKAVADGVGLPLSVQCVALPYQDELCLRLMKEVQTLHMRQMKK